VHERFRLFIFKERFGNARLANDALEGTAPEGIVERHRDGYGGVLSSQLHDSVTAALAHRDKSVFFENLAGL
jgi:hypothetical protein